MALHTHPAAICGFRIRPPKFLSTQAYGLEWIVASHVKAEEASRKEKDSCYLQDFQETFRKRLLQVCCKPETIFTRGHELADFLHQNWNEMEIYPLTRFPQGVGIDARQKVHREMVDAAFEEFYNSESDPPQDILHVSCTGYVSPSSAQKIVSRKQWFGRTTVTHLYHMGCYAAIPAIRIAAAYTHGKNHRSDIVHTEFCTLHHNPLLHDAEHLVAQSLFADGIVKYMVCPEKQAEKKGEPYLKILAVHEQIIPDSTHAMEWVMTDWCFQFVLSKEIPALIAKNVKEYVHALCEKAGVSPQQMFQNGHFAIHPGGPKILQHAQRLLELENEQMQFSYEILKKHGNMSSATLPHIWSAMCADPAVPSGTKIISLAFGPGLTIAGAILEKCDG